MQALRTQKQAINSRWKLALLVALLIMACALLSSREVYRLYNPSGNCSIVTEMATFGGGRVKLKCGMRSVVLKQMSDFFAGVASITWKGDSGGIAVVCNDWELYPWTIAFDWPSGHHWAVLPGQPEYKSALAEISTKYPALSEKHLSDEETMVEFCQSKAVYEQFKREHVRLE